MPARSPLIACVVLAVCVFAGPKAVANAPVELSMVAEVNGVRAQHGLGPLRYSGSLRRSADRYAAWMLRADFFGHQGRIRASRRYRKLGEALALHRGWRAQVRRTVQGWLRSPGHRALILSRGFRHLGAGHSRGSYAGGRDTTWVLHFGG